MGCDIHIKAQKLINGKYVDLPFRPFDWRSYGMFGFLADVRNYSHVPPISQQRGYPDDYDAGEWNETHSASWLSVAELVEFDYEQTFEDRRTTREESPGLWNGAADTGEGNGARVSYRYFLGSNFFDDLEKLQRLGADRIVFDFDN